MKDIHKRLRELREDRGLSLREMASRVVGDGGHGVSHDSVRNYEAGRSIPSDYLIAVCSTFHVSPDWLLFGRGSMRDRPAQDASAALEAVGDIVRAFRGEKEDWRSDGWTGATLRRWDQFVGALGGDGPITTMSLASWHPPEGGGGDGDQPFRKVGASELARRRTAISGLIDEAAEHLTWLELLFRDVRHAVSLTDEDGILVESRASADEILGSWGMDAGTDWSEDGLGSTAVAAALASGELRAVIGTEVEPFHEFACVAAPIRGDSGLPVAVLSLAVELPAANPARMMAVGYAAAMIERRLTES